MRHRLMQAVALAQQQLAQQRLLLITGQQQIQQGGLIQRHAFAKERVDHLRRPIQRLEPLGLSRMGEQAHPVLQVAIVAL